MNNFFLILIFATLSNILVNFLVQLGVQWKLIRRQKG